MLTCDLHVHGTVDHESHRLQMLPSEQWRASCFAAGPLGPADVAVKDRIGIETLTFGSDFIHIEGTYPHSRSRLTQTLAGLTPDERFAITTGNGARVLRLDLEKLSTVPAAQQAWAFA